jgi:hypothetical protein
MCVLDGGDDTDESLHDRQRGGLVDTGCLVKGLHNLKGQHRRSPHHEMVLWRR